MANYLTIDIGGTFIKYAVLDEREQLIHLNKVPTMNNKNQSIIDRVKKIIASYRKRFVLSGIGISTAGIVDRERGKIIYAGPTIPGYRGTHFKRELASYHLPVHVMNDVDAALLGELWKGDVGPYDDVFGMTIGTGIGGALYRNGLIDGTHFQANSIGYLLYEPASDTTFEMRASTSALNKMIAHDLGKGWSTRRVFEEAKQGHGTCVKLIEDWTKEIAAGIAQIILIVDPACIVIGGGVSAQGEFLLEHIKKHIPAFLPKDFMKTELKIATQQNNAALYGAVYPFVTS